MCSGYWHGNVQVRSRRVREVEDLICFLDEVTMLSCIRHENIQLFMGACLSMQEGSLAIVLRYVVIRGTPPPSIVYTRTCHDP